MRIQICPHYHHNHHQNLIYSQDDPTGYLTMKKNYEDRILYRTSRNSLFQARMERMTMLSSLDKNSTENESKPSKAVWIRNRGECNSVPDSGEVWSIARANRSRH